MNFNESFEAELRFAEALQAARSDGPSDPRNAIAAALLPWLSGEDTAAREAAERVIAALVHAPTREAAAHVLALRAEDDTLDGIVAAEALSALAPPGVGQRATTEPIAESDPAVATEDLEGRVTSAVSAALTMLFEAFGGWRPERLTPALVRASATAPPVPGDGEISRASGTLRHDGLHEFGLLEAYEYRITLGSEPATVSIVVDFAAEPGAEPGRVMARLVTADPPRTVAETAVKGTRRVRRATFRDLELARVGWDLARIELVLSDGGDGH